MARNKYPEETVNLIVDQALKLFVEKGYEGTSIQDIINQLGGLSKGAIYHHFKSKEEIFDAACERIGESNAQYYNAIRDDCSKTGLEKLKTMIRAAYANPTNEAMVAVMTRFSYDPKFLYNQIYEIYETVVPEYVQPIIQQGVEDGSIETEYPEELAGVLATLLNVWMNPIICKTTDEGVRRKVRFLAHLLKQMNVDIFDEEAEEGIVELYQKYNRPS